MVDVETWADTLLKHPLKIKYEGLDGYHEDVREAAVCDEQFMEGWMFDQHQSVEDSIGRTEEDFLEPYIDWLLGRLDLRTCSEDLLAKARGTPDYSWEELAELEEEVGEHRFEFACDYIPPMDEWASIREDDPSWLLDKHPPEMIHSHAYGVGIPVEDVWFICPSCKREPHTKESVNEEAKTFYCGLCGAEKVGDDSWADWFESLGVVTWPFSEDKE